MSETPKNTLITGEQYAAERVALIQSAYAGLGVVEIRTEGAAIPGYVPGYADPAPWVARVTEWPRRKLARALERLANWICRDRDEGW